MCIFFCFVCWFPFQDLLPDSLESLGRCWLRRLELQQRQSAEQRVLQARCLQVKGSSTLRLVGYVFSHGCCVFVLEYILGGAFKHFLFSSLFGEASNFD